jgi:phosphoglycolate phosphatase
MSAATFRQIQAVFFDLDGTLVDSAPDLAAAVDAMRVARAMPSLPLARYRPVAGAGARGLLGVAFGVTPEDESFSALREEFFTNYQARLTCSTHAFDGVPELIAALAQRGLPWGVVTNKSERFALPLTQAMPLFESARVVIGGDTTPFSKPHPGPLLEAARRLGVPPQACVYVGDDERDIVAGRAANMATVAATYGYLGQTNEVQHWNAHAHIDNAIELLDLIG